jgi:hypothetical protein
MRKWIALLVLFLLVGCAGTHVKYEKQPFTPPPKSEAYKVPADPFIGIPLPEPTYLKKDPSGHYVVCKKEEAEVAAYTTKDIHNLTIRIVYYRDLNVALENQVNLHIQRENLLINLVVDVNILKELYREFNVDLQNKASSDKTMFNLEKGGYIAVIIGLLIEMGLLIAK